MIEALNWMKQMEDLPLVIAHHPSRSAKDTACRLTEPSELRAWNQVAPEIASAWKARQDIKQLPK
ncbi:MAG: hypothetical protein CM1200mP9_02130 [Gammaproteobacteria bacterium]|nr:MAG: hypothetical protein CM1200mP9_02130 [Gammaproteobacteria bacterium]